MNQLTLYTHPHSRGRNVRWMLEECSADYKVIGVPFGAAMKAPEYRAINPDYSVLRVAERVKQGGHNIPEATIRRRFAARRIALQTDTAIIQTRDGQPVRIDAAALRQKPCHDMA